MDYKVTDTDLTSIANAIRTKGDTSSTLVFPNGFVSAISSLHIDEGATILSGTDAPSSSIGGDGDIYFQLSGIMQELVDRESDLKIAVTANSNWSGFQPWKAFSSSTINSGWIGNGGNPHWLQVEFPSETSIISVEFIARDPSRFHAISRIGYSDDGVNFTDATLTESTASENVGRALLDREYTAKYFRIYFDGEYSSSAYPTMSETKISGQAKYIDSVYSKVDGVWIDVIGANIDEINTGT